MNKEKIEAIKEAIAIDLNHVNLLVKEYLKEIGEDMLEAYWHAFYVKHANDKGHINLDVGVGPWHLNEDNHMIPSRYDELAFIDEEVEYD